MCSPHKKQHSSIQWWSGSTVGEQMAQTWSNFDSYKQKIEFSDTNLNSVNCFSHHQGESKDNAKTSAFYGHALLRIHNGYKMLTFLHYLYFCPNDDQSIQLKYQQGFLSLSWYQRTLFSVRAGANWEATTLTVMMLSSPTSTDSISCAMFFKLNWFSPAYGDPKVWRVCLWSPRGRRAEVGVVQAVQPVCPLESQQTHQHPLSG